MRGQLRSVAVTETGGGGDHRETQAAGGLRLSGGGLSYLQSEGPLHRGLGPRGVIPVLRGGELLGRMMLQMNGTQSPSMTPKLRSVFWQRGRCS